MWGSCAAPTRHEQWSHPRVSPIHADLEGFPPTILVVDTADPIVDGARAFVRKLEEVGNGNVELFVDEGMPHGFYSFPRIFGRKEESYEAVERFLRRHLGTGG